MFHICLFSFVCFAQQDSISEDKGSTTGEIKFMSVIPETATNDTSGAKEEPEMETVEPASDTTPKIAEEIPVDTSEVVIEDPGLKTDSVKAAVENTGKKPPAKMRRSGIGFNIGSRLFFPDDANDMISDIWSEMKSGGIVSSEVGDPTMILATVVKLKGVIYFIPYLCIEPYGQFMWAGKQLKIRGDVSRDASVNLIDFSGGLNCWFKVTPKKRVSFKIGAGGFGGYTMLKVSGDEGETELSGYSYGGNICTGLDICFRKLSINLDLIVPLGKTKFSERTGRLDLDENANYEYPEIVSHNGVEIRPGLTIHF